MPMRLRSQCRSYPQATTNAGLTKRMTDAGSGVVNKPVQTVAGSSWSLAITALQQLRDKMMTVMLTMAYFCAVTCPAVVQYVLAGLPVSPVDGYSSISIMARNRRNARHQGSSRTWWCYFLLLVFLPFIFLVLTVCYVFLPFVNHSKDELQTVSAPLYAP